MKLGKSDVLAVIALITISILVYLPWFAKPQAIFTWGDWGFYFQQTAKQFFSWPSVWRTDSLGGIEIGMPIFPIARVLFGALSYIFSEPIVTKLIYIYPSIILPPLTMFFLMRNFTKDRVALLIGSTFFTFNHYFLTLRNGHFTLLNAFALGPLIIYLFISCLKNYTFKKSILLGLIISLSTYFEIRSTYVVAIVMLVLFISQKSYVSNIQKLIPSVIVVLFANIFWVVSLTPSISSGELSILSRPLVGEGGVNIVSATQALLKAQENMPKVMWAIPFFSFFGLWLYRKKSLISAFGVVAIIGIFLTKLTAPPFTEVYRWIYQYIPGFSAFRDPSKFIFLVVISYSLFISMFTTYIRSRYRSTFGLITTLVVFAVTLSPVTGVFSGQYGKLLHERHPLSEYSSFNESLSKDESTSFYRTLYIPRDSRWGYWDFNKPKLSLMDLLNYNWSFADDYNDQGLDYSEYGMVKKFFEKDISEKLIKASSIKYIVVPPPDKTNNDYFLNEIPNREKYISLLRSLPYLRHIKEEYSSLDVFEVQVYSTRFTTESGSEVKYRMLRPTMFELDTSNLRPKEKIIFSDAFHPSWQIEIGQNVSFSKKTNLLFNEFELPSKAKNSIVRFTPQDKLDMGIVITTTAMLIFIGIVLKK